MGLAQKERNAQEILSGTQMQQKPAYDVNELGLTPTQGQGQVRLTMPLPGGSSVGTAPAGIGGVEPNLAAELVGPAFANELQGTQLLESGPAKETAKPEPQKIYTVRQGDSLAEIAKKVYGVAEGNKLANITRIFKANRNQLKSVDAIQVGQKLVIPSLPVGKDKPSGVVSGSAFEKVESVGESHVQPSAQDSTQTSWYVVRQGDSLWKIAASQLGNGSRFSEITKLNTDILKSQNDLVIGMRLRMPAR
jgi:nucleoid-associated protein YgaU